VSRKRLRVAAPVAAAAALIGVASGLAASHDHKAILPESYRVSGTLKGTGSVSGLFIANLVVSGSTRTLAWKFTLRPSGTASAAQIRAGATATGKRLVNLCAPCSAGAHGTTTISSVALAALVTGNAGVVVLTRAAGTLHGAASISVRSTPTLVAAGKAIVTKYSCAGCHTSNGQNSTGPTWKGLAGSKVHQTDGTTVIASDSYLIRVINDPSKLKVEGYDSGIMSEMIPPGTITPAQATAIVAYIKTLK